MPPMTDDEIRKLVRAKLADGTLPDGRPEMIENRPGQPTQYLMEPARSETDPCAVCGQGSTQRRHNYPEKTLSFHTRCGEVWLEEADKL